VHPAAAPVELAAAQHEDGHFRAVSDRQSHKIECLRGDVAQWPLSLTLPMFSPQRRVCGALLPTSGAERIPALDPERSDTHSDSTSQSRLSLVRIWLTLLGLSRHGVPPWPDGLDCVGE
jgi:hypothetical protein